MICLIWFSLLRDPQILLLQYVFIFIPQHGSWHAAVRPRGGIWLLKARVRLSCPVDLLVVACAIMDQISVFFMEAGGMLSAHKQEGVSVLYWIQLVDLMLQISIGFNHTERQSGKYTSATFVMLVIHLSNTAFRILSARNNFHQVENGKRFLVINVSSAVFKTLSLLNSYSIIFRSSAKTMDQNHS